MNTTPSWTSFGALRSAPYTGIGLWRVALVIALTWFVSGCGLKGDLYLPETSPVVVTPAASSSSSSSSESSQATP